MNSAPQFCHYRNTDLNILTCIICQGTPWNFRKIRDQCVIYWGSATRDVGVHSLSKPPVTLMFGYICFRRCDSHFSFLRRALVYGNYGGYCTGCGTNTILDISVRLRTDFGCLSRLVLLLWDKWFLMWTICIGVRLIVVIELYYLTPATSITSRSDLITDDPTSALFFSHINKFMWQNLCEDTFYHLLPWHCTCSFVIYTSYRKEGLQSAPILVFYDFWDLLQPELCANRRTFFKIVS